MTAIMIMVASGKVVGCKWKLLFFMFCYLCWKQVLLFDNKIDITEAKF